MSTELSEKFDSITSKINTAIGMITVPATQNSNAKEIQNNLLEIGTELDTVINDVLYPPSPWRPAAGPPECVEGERTSYLVKTIDVYGVALWREYDYGWDWESDCGEVVKWMPIP